MNADQINALAKEAMCCLGFQTPGWLAVQALRDAAMLTTSPTSPAPGAAPPVQPLQYPDHLDMLSTLRADVPLTDERIDAVFWPTHFPAVDTSHRKTVLALYVQREFFRAGYRAAIRNQGAAK